MASINRKVIDISHWNDVTSWQAVVGAGIIGVIQKATEGTGYTDNTYAPRKAPAVSAGLKWGAYHFANGSDVTAQVNHFLSVTGVHDDMLYALDWEDDPNGNTMSKNQAHDFLAQVDARVGANRCVIYSGNVAKEKLGNTADPFFGAHRLWLAQYGATPQTQASWSTYWLWQYSDGSVGPTPHGCPGVTGAVDTNSWAGSDAELVAQWSGAGAPPVVTKPVVNINITTQGDVVVLVNGQMIQVAA